VAHRFRDAIGLEREQSECLRDRRAIIAGGKRRFLNCRAALAEAMAAFYQDNGLETWRDPAGVA